MEGASNRKGRKKKKNRGSQENLENSLYSCSGVETEDEDRMRFGGPLSLAFFMGLTV